jgi:hypothetical protein
MQNLITETVLSAWRNQGKHRETPSGWITANAVCCEHRGHNRDRRSRGGLILDNRGGISYHCFNCKFKSRYEYGGTLSFNFRNLLGWLGLSDASIRSLILEALRISQNQITIGEQLPLPEVKVRDFTESKLPEGSVSFQQMATWIRMQDDFSIDKNFSDQVDYIWKRKINLQKYDFYWCQKTGMNRRIIIPFYWNDKCVGYQTRNIDPGNSRYFSQFESGYVFNINQQQQNWSQVLVCEGAFDAMSVDGCATLGSTISEAQANLIETLNKPVIVVPDLDKSGASMIDHAIKYHWSVSFPVWFETCKDINQALIKYGRLFTIKAILDSVETSRLRIEIMKRRWF